MSPVCAVVLDGAGVYVLTAGQANGGVHQRDAGLRRSPLNHR
jgi:hypothetical protein